MRAGLGDRFCEPGTPDSLPLVTRGVTPVTGRAGSWVWRGRRGGEAEGHGLDGLQCCMLLPAAELLLARSPPNP
jgi:hypothetical protein